MSSSLIDKISQSFDTDCKVVSNEFSLMGESFSVFYIESMIDKALFSSGILAPIEKLIKSENETQSSTKNSKTKNSQNQKQTQSNSNQSSSNEKSDLKDKIKSEVVSITSVEELTEINQIIDKILSGYAVVAFEKEALCYPIFGAEKRGIEEPPNSRVIKGPREGFVEDLSTNVGLIRKRVKRTIESYLKYLNTVSNKFSSVSLEDEQKYIIDKFLPRFPFPHEDYEYYEDAIVGDVPCCMAQVKKECYTLEPNFIILLSIYISYIDIIRFF